MTGSPITIFGCATLPPVEDVRDRYEAYYDLNAINAAARKSTLDVELRGVVLKNVQSLLDLPRSATGQRFVHLSLPFVEADTDDTQQVLFASDDGSKTQASVDAIVNRLVDRDPDLLVVTGPAAHRIAEAFFRQSHGCPVIAEAENTRPGPTVRSTFFERLYRSILSDPSTRLQDAFTSANDQAQQSAGAPNPYYRYLPGEIDVRESNETGARLASDFLRLTQALQALPLDERNEQVAEIHRQLNDPESRHQVHIAGPSMSGKTALLRACERFAVNFDRPAITLDMKDYATDLDLVEALERQVTDRVHLTLTDALAESAILVMVDNFRTVGAGSAFLRTFNELGAHAGSRALVAWAAGVNIDHEYDLAALHLGMISAETAARLGAEKADDKRARGPAQLIGTLRTALRHRTPDGEPDLALYRRATSLGDTLQRLCSDQASRALLGCFTVLGRTVHRAVIEAAFDAADPGLEPGDFSAASRALQSEGLMYVESLQTVSDDAPQQHWVIEPGALRVLKEFPTMGSEVTAALTAATQAAIRLAESKSLRQDDDVVWLDSLTRNLLQRDMVDLVCELADPLVWPPPPKGALRSIGTTDQVADLLRRLIEGTRSQPSLSGQCSLTLGERFYTAGKRVEADEAFAKAVASSDVDDTLLRALRARGQIAYRRGDYEDALAFYDQATDHLAGSDPKYVASLRIHQSKALMRMGDFETAENLLTWAQESCESINDDRGRRRAEHELARLLEETRPDLQNQTRQSYLGVLTVARIDGDTRMICGPLYQLCLLELRAFESTGEALHLRSARKHAEDCHTHAKEIRDDLWDCLSRLALGLVAAAEGDSAEASQLIADAGKRARERDYGQARRDAESWARNKSLPPAFAHRSGVIDTPKLSDAKLRKALFYAAQPERLLDLEVRFRSTSSDRELHATFADAWSCDCDLFAESGECTHTYAVRRILRFAPPYDALKRREFRDRNDVNNSERRGPGLLDGDSRSENGIA